MARAAVTAGFQDVGDVRRDLESVRLGLGRELTALLRSSGDSVARKTGTLTPRGPGPQSVKDNLPHIGSTMVAVATTTGVAVATTHPGGAVLNFGGTISPRGVPITFERHLMAQKAGEAELPGLERDVTRRVNDLLAAHGL